MAETIGRDLCVSNFEKFGTSNPTWKPADIELLAILETRPGGEADPLWKDDIVGTSEEEMIFPEELEVINQLRQELPDLKFYTDKFAARFLIACKHHHYNTRIKLERYLLLKQRCGIRTGLLPLYAIDRAPMNVKDIRKPANIAFRGSKDWKGRQILWTFQENVDPEFDHDEALRSPLVWNWLFLEFEMRSYQFPLADFRKPGLHISIYQGAFPTYAPGAAADQLRFWINAFRVLPYTIESSYEYMPKWRDRLKLRWKFFTLRRFFRGYPHRMHIVSKRDIKRMVPKQTRLDIFGGSVPFNWDYSVYTQGCIAAEGLLLKYWARVREKFQLPDPKILPSEEIDFPKWVRARPLLTIESASCLLSDLWSAMRGE